jgi:hypothetical protein
MVVVYNKINERVFCTLPWEQEREELIHQSSSVSLVPEIRLNEELKTFRDNGWKEVSIKEFVEFIKY